MSFHPCPVLGPGPILWAGGSGRPGLSCLVRREERGGRETWSGEWERGEDGNIGEEGVELRRGDYRGLAVSYPRPIMLPTELPQGRWAWRQGLPEDYCVPGTHHSCPHSWAHWWHPFIQASFLLPFPGLGPQPTRPCSPAPLGPLSWCQHLCDDMAAGGCSFS
jgi:hypothetical protein